MNQKYIAKLNKQAKTFLNQTQEATQNFVTKKVKRFDKGKMNKIINTIFISGKNNEYLESDDNGEGNQ